jgi:hypothetical protein
MSETTTPTNLNLSRFQYGDLKYIFHNRVTMASLRKANMTTLSSLAYRGYLRRVGMTDDSEVFLTPAGEAALKRYGEATMNTRQHERELTDRCLRLLKHSRRIVSMQQVKKTA